MHVKNSYSAVILVLFGYVSTVLAHRGWKPPTNRMCPSEDEETHECYELTREDATCIVNTVEGCDPAYTHTCVIMTSTTLRPCYVYTCSHRGCCEGYTEDDRGICVPEYLGGRTRCENGGTWDTDHCVCQDQFQGTFCQTPTCDHPCVNGGKCEVSGGQPTCICPSSRYTGQHCETAVCKDKCENGGVCQQDGVLAKCDCLAGFQGDRCQFAVNAQCPIVPDFKTAEDCDIGESECQNDSDCYGKGDYAICCFDGCQGVCKKLENNTCVHNGTKHHSGEVFTPETDTCQRCVCQMWGHVQCTPLSCPTRQCPDEHTPVNIDGHCCKVCPGEDINSVEEPSFTNCPERFIAIETTQFDDIATLPDLNLEAKDAYGDQLSVTYSETVFYHSHQLDIHKNVHIVSAHSDCDRHGRRAECHFKVIVKDPFPPVFTSCPAEIYALTDEAISWQDPSAKDNVGIYQIKADGDTIRSKTLAVGTYPVSYTVWDFDQNQAICAFLVRVFDTNTQDSDMPSNLRARRNDKLSIGTVVGVTVGLILASGVSMCFIVGIRRRRFEQNQPENENSHGLTNNIYAICGTGTQNAYVNSKLPNLPDYSPPMHPPSYDQIDQCEELGGAICEEPPIYEEIGSKTDNHEYENMESTLDNYAYVNETPNMEYMKI